MSAVCHRKRCRAVLDIFTDLNGRTLAVCRPCERNANGLCRGCPNRTPASTGKVKPFWCSACQREQDRKRHRRAYRANPEHYRRAQKKSAARRSPEQREQVRQRKREWHQKHYTPRSAADRLYKREWSRQKAKDPAWLEHRRSVKRAYESQPHVKAKMQAYRRDYYRRFAA